DHCRSRALFATHYHELTVLASTLPAVAAWQVTAREWKGEIIFLHQVKPGAADRSYGVQVARLAGLPKRVTDRASSILRTLEQEGSTATLSALAGDLPLFHAAARPLPVLQDEPESPDLLRQMLDEIQPDSLIPRE